MKNNNGIDLAIKNKTLKSLPTDEFVERIPYGETQRYVKKVLTTLALYRRLYPAQ